MCNLKAVASFDDKMVGPETLKFTTCLLREVKWHPFGCSANDNIKPKTEVVKRGNETSQGGQKGKQKGDTQK